MITEEISLIVMIAPNNEDDKLPNYLIEKIDNNYLIHRELEHGEMRYYKRDEIFEYNGEIYVFGIANCSSEESAKVAIKGYWDAIHSSKTLVNNKCL